jgi:processive 1,2-diacylglycerol beta-glucosyltransferase
MGNGHIRAAGALEACAEERYPHLRVTNVNIKDYMPFVYKKMFHDLYLYFANKCPFAWSFIYYNTDKPYPETALGRFFSWFRRRIRKRMMREVLKYKPDYIICSHFIPAEILNEYKSQNDFKVPVSVIVTDFSLHWVYINTVLDNYFVNCTEVKNLLISRGVAEKHIHITGCPVFPEFTRKYPREEVIALRRKNGFDAETPIFLVMMGGNGVGKLTGLCEILLKRFPEYGVIAMAGANPKKIKALKELEKDYPGRLLTVPFTDEVAQYLAMSDIIVTKPSGISTSECIAMEKPMVIINPIPGQEERNVDYLIERGIITKAYCEDSLQYREVLPSSDRLKFIAEQLKNISLPNAGYDILEIALKNN